MCYLSHRAFVRFVSAGLLVVAGLASADDVILNPGHIAGTIQVEGVEFDFVSLTASHENFLSSKNIEDSQQYKLTVNIPDEAGSPYRVQAAVYSNYRYNTLYLQDEVTVYSGLTSTLDFNATPGTISGLVSADGAEVSHGRIDVHSLSKGQAQANASGRFFNGGSFSIPALPGDTLLITGEVTLSDGRTLPLPVYETALNAAGNSYLDIQLNQSTADQGILAATLDIPGAAVNKYIVRGSSYSENYGLSSFAETINDSGLHTFSLNPGDWTLFVDSYIGDRNDDTLTLPGHYFNRNITIEPNSYQLVGSSVETSGISGDIVLRGSMDKQAIQRGTLTATGGNSGLAAGGYSKDNLGSGGSYDLLLTPGSWSPHVLNMRLYDTEAGLLDAINLNLIMDNHPQTLAAGDNINGGLEYETGSVTVNFLNLGDELISRPLLYANCQGEGYNYSASTQASRLIDVAFASVKLAAPAAVCDITARAYVNNNLTTFGQFQIEIVGNNDTQRDVGAPDLTIHSPAAELVTANAQLSVSGLAQDPDGVASIVVNGSELDITVASNVDFSQLIELDEGRNQLLIIATDTTGQMTLDRRDVYLDSTPPTASWTPANHSSFTEAHVMISGSATDAYGIQQVTLNGVTLTVNPVNDETVSFDYPADLSVTDEYELVVIDNNGNHYREVRSFQFDANRAPVAQAGADTTLECQGQTTRVNLDGSGSHDPDGDILHYSWHTVGGSYSGAQVALDLATGSHDITLNVSDGEFSTSDTVTITISDSTAPLISADLPATLEATSVEGANFKPAVSVSDRCGSASYHITPADGALAMGDNRVLIEATDSAGNTSHASQIITVVDTTPPTLTPPPNMQVVAGGELTWVDVGMATATDIFKVVVSNDLPAEGFPVGTHIVNWLATDANGNQSTAIQVVEVQYDFCGGFLPPLKEGMSINGKRTLPVKFELCYANGQPAGDAEPLLKIWHKDSDSYVTSQPMQQRGNHYQYKLKTRKLDKGDYQLQVILKGQSLPQTLNFSIR